MKKFPLVYFRRAQRDLVGIFTYIQRDSPAQAKSWVDKIDRQLGRLSRFPDSGVIPKDERLALLGYRVVVIGDYLAFYKVQRGRVEIRRIIHGRRRYAFLV